MSTTKLTLQPPPGLFAAVQVHGQDGRIVGAAPAFDVDGERMVPAQSVGVDCQLTAADLRVRCAWVHEDSSAGLMWTDFSVVEERPATRRTRR